uniref:Divergent protein kinase domain 1C n=1 Tax=Sinocyclocheilus anshuiensis TaxID=1608454 RepID=A0A671MBM2_9TELE
ERVKEEKCKSKSNNMHKMIIRLFCKIKYQGVLTGDLCEDLCVAGRVEYKRCLYYENGKKVMAASWHGVPIVLKSKLENFSSYEALALLEYQDTAGGTGGEEELSPLDVVFYATLEIKNSLGLETGTNLTLPRLWGQKLKENERTYSRAELASLWALLHFLEMVEHFENDFSHSLHLCDIKPENFAIRKDLTVVAIDVDMAFFEPKMRDILEQNCTSDNDCNFFDCVSKCDKAKNRCGPKRKNSNLQVICEKIFRPWFSPTLLGAKAGLPLQVELQRAVQECAEIDGGEDAKRSRAVRKQLQDLLVELIQ